MPLFILLSFEKVIKYEKIKKNSQAALSISTVCFPFYRVCVWERESERKRERPFNLMIISLCRNYNSPWSGLLTSEYSTAGSSGAWRENRARHPVSGSGECRGRCRSTRCTQVPGRWTGQGHSFLGHTDDLENSERDDKDPVTNKVRVKLLVSDKTTLIFSFTYSIIISSTLQLFFSFFYEDVVEQVNVNDPSSTETSEKFISRSTVQWFLYIRSILRWGAAVMK